MSSSYKKPTIQTNHSNIPTILYGLVAVVLYGFGLFSVFDRLTAPENQEVIDDVTEGFNDVVGVSLPFLPLILSLLGLFIIVSLVMSYVIVWIMSKIAQEVTIVVAIVAPFLIMGIGGLMIVASTDLMLVGAIIALVGVGLLVFVIWRFQSIKRSGQFVEFSAQLVLDEKAVLGMPILLGLFTIVTGFFMLFGFLEILALFEMQDTTTGETGISPVGLIAGLVFEYFYLIIYFGVYYSLSGGVVSYASDWYRGLDPDLGSAMADVRQTLPVIIKFAFAMATVKIIVQALTGAGRQRTGRQMSGGAIAGMVLGGIAGIFVRLIGAFWQFLNYFTLVSIIQNKEGLVDSIKDSAKTTWKSLLDVLVGETGYGLTMFIFAILNSSLWIGAGFLIGVVGFGGDLFAAIVVAFVFLILSSLPYNMVTMPMKVAFRTFMYSYAKDYMDGFKKPSRLPADLRGEFKNLQQRSDKRKMKDPNMIF